MKKRIIILFILLSISIGVYPQASVDIGVPTNSPFQLGGDIRGNIENSVNEPTGKVTLSSSLGTIAAALVSYGVNLTFNGQTTFKNGQQTNKYNPTSVVGVGWSLNIPKIIVDNKNTAIRDDDEFYLLDGATNTKLLCVDRGTNVNGSVWKFQMEKYSPWKIEFYYHNSWGDYWKITDDKGVVSYYGDPVANTARDYVVCYGNWIGSSVQNGATGQQAIQWNLYKVEDQWGNNLTFEYDYVTQNMSGYAQTEASYLKKIISSTGATIELIYSDKNFNEYYEPHQEKSEPDAYQERYEKKYLQKVDSYNNKNLLVSTYNIGYTLNGEYSNTKRYLTSLTQTVYNNGQNETLPAQTFDYHYTGNFKGGLKTITYPTGGSITFNYNNKFLFNNSSNRFEVTDFSQPSGYIFHNAYVSDNYGIFVFRTNNTVSGDKYRFKFFRVWWNGQAWEWNEFTFPYLIPDPNSANEGGSLKDFYTVLEKDFYGFVYDSGSTAVVHLWHLEGNGRSWNYFSSSSKNIGTENPSFVSGSDFAALLNHRGGEIYTFVWNGTSWSQNLINQGGGQYYIAATNNYIVSLDEDGGSDMINGISYDDNYYIHYLDAEKNWQTKSWSAFVTPQLAGIEKASYFYPDNSIIGFVADDNPEVFLRWDTNYNLTNIDNVLGGYSDSFPIIPVSSSMFTIMHDWYQYSQKSARFNGINWSISSLPYSGVYYARPNFGEDLITFQDHPMYSPSYKIAYHMYDPNYNSWSYNSLNSHNWTGSSSSGINQEFVVSGKMIYKRSNQGVPTLPFGQIGMLQYDNGFTYSDGLSHAFVEQQENINGSIYFKYGSYLYIDKFTDQLGQIDLGQKTHLYGSSKMGGYTPFMSPNSIWIKENVSGGFHKYFHRIIDDKLNNDVFDIVVNHIDINDDNGNLRKIQYTYNKPKCTPDNSTTYYGQVIIENKGVGNGNIGKVVKRYNNGSDDLTMIGLPLEVLIKDANNNVIKKATTTWNKYFKDFYSNGYFYKSYYIRPIKEKEEMYFNNTPNLVIETTHEYNNAYGLKTSSSSVDSNGRSVKENINYAYQAYYNFMFDKNMLSFPYQKYTTINGSYVKAEQSRWVNVNGKVYIDELLSGSSTYALRLDRQISTVESSTGNVLETNNGKGLFSSVLFGYNNLYEVATINNAKYLEIVNQLDLTYTQLQNLSTTSLKTELLKLYDRLPNASINLTFYDDNGRVISRIDERRQEVFVFYDTVGRVDYTTDSQGNILEKKVYHVVN